MRARQGEESARWAGPYQLRAHTPCLLQASELTCALLSFLCTYTRSTKRAHGHILACLSQVHIHSCVHTTCTCSHSQSPFLLLVRTPAGGHSGPPPPCVHINTRGHKINLFSARVHTLQQVQPCAQAHSWSLSSLCTYTCAQTASHSHPWVHTHRCTHITVAPFLGVLTLSSVSHVRTSVHTRCPLCAQMHTQPGPLSSVCAHVHTSPAPVVRVRTRAHPTGSSPPRA